MLQKMLQKPLIQNGILVIYELMYILEYGKLNLYPDYNTILQQS